MQNFGESDIYMQNINHMCTNMHDTMLYEYPNVIGIGHGRKIINNTETNTPTLTYFVKKKIPSSQLSQESIIPSTINGVKTDIIETSTVSAQVILVSPYRKKSYIASQDGPPSISYTSMYRPMYGGISCSVVDLSGAGTLGCGVIDLNNVYLLSNNHVIANSNKSNIGSYIYQPAYLEGGSSTTPIARLFAMKKIIFGSSSKYPSNRIDAAIGYIGKRSDPTVNQRINSGIISLGKINGIKTTLTVGEGVSKVGRTTGYTTGKIISINSSIIVSYSSTESALFTGQIMTSSMSKPGDSGSIGLDSTMKGFGLLFAGSDTLTIFNPISEVLSAFNVSLL